MKTSTGEILKIASVAMGICAMLAGCAAPKPRPDDNIDDGLVRVDKALLDELYVSPDAPLAHYKRVMIDPIEVTFKDGWRKQHPDLNDKDFESLQTRLATSLREVLVAEFARGGYVLVESPANDVLRVRASITDANFASPESGEDKHTFVKSAGEMTLRVQAYDGPSGTLVARAKDYEFDPETRNFERADRTSTNVAARRIFAKWAEELRSALDVAKVSADARKPQG